MVIDNQGFRLNVGIVLCNDAQQVFWGKRIGQDSWQFPQGGVNPRETVEETMYRELGEELGLDISDVIVLGSTKHWIRYRLPKQYIRQKTKPTVIGQKQKWFLLKLRVCEQKIRLNVSDSPEFDSWRWVAYDYPAQHVIYFKRDSYQKALAELQHFLPQQKGHA